jgi:hypothetical protein
MVAGGGFEPPKLSRQIYSLIPLAARESRLKLLKLSTAFPVSLFEVTLQQASCRNITCRAASKKAVYSLRLAVYCQQY